MSNCHNSLNSELRLFQGQMEGIRENRDDKKGFFTTSLMFGKPAFGPLDLPQLAALHAHRFTGLLSFHLVRSSIYLVCRDVWIPLELP